jgi:N-acetylglucosamine-6-phosphate deacetylase
MTVECGVRRVGDGAISGSTLTMAQSFRNAARRSLRSIGEASAPCSATPAAVLGARRKGHLATGMDAYLVLLDAELNVQATVVGGIVGNQSSQWQPDITYYNISFHILTGAAGYDRISV